MSPDQRFRGHSRLRQHLTAVQAIVSLWFLVAHAEKTDTLAGERVVSVDSFRRAVAEALPGTTLLLADGLYKDVVLEFKAVGRPGAPIQLRAHHPGKAIITGRSQLTITGEHLVVSGLLFDQAWGFKVVEFAAARHCRLTDCAFIECGNPASTFSHVVYLVNGSSYNRVDHCYMQGSLSMSMGVRVKENDHGSVGNRFDHNYFKDILRRSNNGQEAVQVGQGKDSCRKAMHTLVEFCLFDNASGDGEIVCNKSACNTYRCSTFRNCRGSISLRSGGSALVQGNVVLGCDGGVRVHAVYSAIVGNYIEGCNEGVTFDRGDGPEPDVAGHTAANHCVVGNNVIRNCKTSGIRIGHIRHSSGTPIVPFANLFVNNVVCGNSGTLVRFDAPNSSTWAGNSVWAEGGAQTGVPLPGVVIGRVDLLDINDTWVLPPDRAKKIRDHALLINPMLAGMACPRAFDEVFPTILAPKVMKPNEVGPYLDEWPPRIIAADCGSQANFPTPPEAPHPGESRINGKRQQRDANGPFMTARKVN